MYGLCSDSLPNMAEPDHNNEPQSPPSEFEEVNASDSNYSEAEIIDRVASPACGKIYKACGKGGKILQTILFYPFVNNGLLILIPVFQNCRALFGSMVTSLIHSTERHA